MSFDPNELSSHIARFGTVIRIVVADHAGSTPRETGTSMLVFDGGSTGTIGGGALEFEAIARAHGMLGGDSARITERVPLGPNRGQCCGGSVTLAFEKFEAAPQLTSTVFARPVEDNARRSVPLSIKRLLKTHRNQGQTPPLKFTDGWLVEPVQTQAQPLWIYGAGHVGRALVNVLAELPEFDITWVDTAPDRFPNEVPQNLRVLPAVDPVSAVPLAPPSAFHLILTYSHALDLALCHSLLTHGFGWAGLIGSRTKWARFQRRLNELGHETEQILGICCPIGRPELGKHPVAIAVGVTEQLLLTLHNSDAKSKIGGATG